jgi:hypothetical protein
MDYATGTARLVEPGNLEGRGVAAVLDRSEIEQALRSKESTELILDVARQGDVEAHTLGVRWDPPDLEEVLRTTEGDRIAIAFDREELQDALTDDDVEGHGLREKALVLSVAVATATAAVGSAQGMVAGGGSSSSGQPAAAIGGAVAAAGDQSPAEVTGAAVSTAEQPIGGAVAASGDQSPAETTGAAISTADQPIGGAVAASGGESPAVAIGGAGPRPVPASDQGPAFAAPGDGLSGAEIAGLAGLGGIAITAAAFAAAGQRRRPVEPA